MEKGFGNQQVKNIYKVLGTEQELKKELYLSNPTAVVLHLLGLRGPLGNLRKPRLSPQRTVGLHIQHNSPGSELHDWCPWR